MRIDFVDDEGFDSFITIPTMIEVCHRCGGRGVHDCFDGGFSMDDEFVDGDFLEDYFGGMYDTTCTECNGKNVVEVPDYDALSPEQMMIVQDKERYEHEIMMERRYGY